MPSNATLTPVNVLAPEEVLTTPKVRFLDTRSKSLHSLVRLCTPEDVRVLKDAAAKWLAEMPQAGAEDIPGENIFSELS